MRGIYQFGPYRLGVQKAVLKRDDGIVPLPPKVFDLLVLLAANGDGVLAKEKIFQKLWPDVRVEESNLSQTVFTLRRRLGQTPSGPRAMMVFVGSKLGGVREGRRGHRPGFKYSR